MHPLHDIETRTLKRNTREHKRAELADVLNRIFAGEELEFPYDQCMGIVVNQLDRKWRGKWDRDDVADIMGEFWDAGMRLHTPEKGNPVNLLVRIALNFMSTKARKAPKEFRSAKEWGRTSTIAVDPEDLKLMEHLVSYEDVHTIREWDLSSLHEAINELTPLRASTLRLFFFSGLTSGQIARLEGAPKPTISARVATGLKQLGPKLVERGILPC